ncbi:hypothetical protein GS291_001360 [Salmonella enterica]|nr:hypothetical protein [Salmonella enterica]
MFYKKEVVEYYSFTVCIFRLFLFVVNSVCQREKGAGGDLQPQTNKTIGKQLPMRVRTSVMAVTARESKGSPVLFAGTANLVVIVTTGMQVCRKQTGTRRIFLPH